MPPKDMSRREFLAASGAATAAAAVTAAAASSARLPAAVDDAPVIIDCHAHLYHEDEKAYPPIEKPYRPPAGTGTVAHLRREMKAAGVTSVVAIHTFTFYGWDNRLIADACRDNRDVGTGVCLLDPDDPNSVRVLERYVKESNIRGLRFTNNKKAGLLDEPGNSALLATCQRLGITANVLTNRDSRPQIESLAGRYPKLNIVIDHALNLVAGETYEAILNDLLAMARFPNLHAKLSHVVTGSKQEYPFTDMHESCRKIIQAYGPERCLWGSDFPCELWCPKATYSQHLRVFTHELGLDEKTKRQILGETPRRLWFAA